MAEGQGFEPWRPLQVYIVSNDAHSATMRSLPNLFLRQLLQLDGVFARVLHERFLGAGADLERDFFAGQRIDDGFLGHVWQIAAAGSAQRVAAVVAGRRSFS